MKLGDDRFLVFPKKYLQELELAWVSWEDISQLEREPYSALLSRAWKEIKKEVSYVFSKVGQNFQDIRNAFRRFELTMDPQIDKEFDPARNMLTINVWFLFFSVFSNDSTLVGFSPNFMVGRTFIHEFDHYSFLKSKKMLGASRDRREQFDTKHRRETEEKAIMAEIDYLKKCKKKLPPTFDFISFSTTGRKRWATTWHPGNATSRVINGLLRQCDEMLALVREDQNGFAYNQESKKRAVENHLRISKALIGIDQRFEHKDYKRITINF